MTKETTKSLPVTKSMVWRGYKQVKRNKGAAGIDRQSIEDFDANYVSNLYKLWNRMSSGSYFPPPVRTVSIPKKGGGSRSLGIPTVSDRIAQAVVKQQLEPLLEKVFHADSFGYRPARSAHQAVAVCERRCRRYDWVIDVDIRGFFDNIDHDIMMDLLGRHTQQKWILLYVNRWLKAGVEQADGSIVPRERGTPQGGVISPLLANLYLHHAFDEWMKEQNPRMPFERYADDIVIHCNSREEAEELLEALKARMKEYKLELHPEKTRMVYCNDHRDKAGDNAPEHERSFKFLGFSFEVRRLYSRRRGLCYQLFAAAISNEAKTNIRQQIREIMGWQRHASSIEEIADEFTLKLQGWINYYGAFMPRETVDVFRYLNSHLLKWLKKTYKIGGWKEAVEKLRGIQRSQPSLFMHWQYGVTGALG